MTFHSHSRSLYGRRTGPVVVRAISSASVECSGATGAVIAAAETLDVRWMRQPTGAGVLVRQADIDDVMALLESRGRRIEVTL